MNYIARPLLIVSLVFVFATTVFLSCDINGHRKTVYIADLSVRPALVTKPPTPNEALGPLASAVQIFKHTMSTLLSGSWAKPRPRALTSSGVIQVVFYGNNYSTYVNDSSISFSKDDWDITKNIDSTVLTARTDRSTMNILSYGAPLEVGLLRFSAGGSAILTDGLGSQRDIDLHADKESIFSITIGGDQSAVPPVAGNDFLPSFYLKVIYWLIIAVFLLLAFYQTRTRDGLRLSGKYSSPPAMEIAGYAAPLLLMPILFQLAYWPANVPYDGSIEWMEAALPGHLGKSTVMPVTLFFRIFTKISISPAPLIFCQIVLAALAISLLLREIRKRGVSWQVAQLAAICIATLPQYPTFFSTLSKDAWNCLGLLFLAYAALSLLRHYNNKSRLKISISLTVIALSAVFAGMMRPNTLPAIVVFLLLIAIYFRKRIGTKLPASLFVAYLASAIFAPTVVTFYSAESQAERANAPLGNESGQDAGFPLGAFANIYLYHLFAAAVHSDVPIKPRDAEIFYKIAPKTAWQEYDCSNVDKTQTALTKYGLLRDIDSYLSAHQVDMAFVVLKLISQNPRVILQRQLCASKMLWYIGYHTFPFQANATLGYDGVSANFLASVGENRSLIGSFVRQSLRDYCSWTETWTHLWLFWKPFLYLSFGLFGVLLYTVVQKRYDVLLVATLPLMLTLSLAVVIPFPAFRYQFPATLLFMLLFLFSLARPDLTEPDGVK